MSFVATYNSASIRGWQSPGVITTLTTNQVINSPIIANNVAFGRVLSLSGNGTYLAASGIGVAAVYIQSGNSFSIQTSLSLVNLKLNGIGNILIGSRSNATTGFCDVYSRTGSSWTLQQSLTSSIANNQNFASAIAIDSSGNTIVSCEPDQFGITTYGAISIFIYSGNSYLETQRINLLGPTQKGSQDQPLSISGDGNYIMVGCAAGASSCYTDVYAKSGNTFSYQTRLTPSNATIGDLFGQSVSLNYSGSIGLIGAPNQIISGNSNVGAAYTFVRSSNTWSQSQTFTINPATPNATFATSCCISSDSLALVVGAVGNGNAYVYTNLGTNFFASQRLQGNANLRFYGQGVAISNATNLTTAVGAQGANIAPRTDVGKVVIYSTQA